jgi:TonB family protein
VERSQADGGVVPNLERVIAGTNARFRSCYAHGFATQHGQEGRLRIVGQIASNGKVSDVRVEGGKGLSSDVVECALQRVKEVTFAPPQPVPSTASFVVTLRFELDDAG